MYIVCIPGVYHYIVQGKAQQQIVGCRYGNDNLSRKIGLRGEIRDLF